MSSGGADATTATELPGAKEPRAAAASSNGSSGAAGAPSEQERELAREAQLEYTRANYQECAALLEKLEALRPQDLKVTHNKIVVEYHRSGDPRRTEILRKSLNAICVQPSNGTLAEADLADRSVSRYNQAVILYHTGQYRAALDIVNSLFAQVEPMDESLVHKVCLLLIELNLTLGRPNTALALVNYIEAQFTSTADSSKSTLTEQNQLQKNEGMFKSNSRTASTVLTDKEQKKDSIDVATDAFRIKLLKYKLRIYLRTLQLKLCKREWKTLVSLGMPTNLSTIFLKANLEYLRKNFKKAIKFLNNIDSTTCPDFKSCGESIAVLYYNNIASLHFAMGKPNLACYYLKIALEENKKVIDSIKTTETSSTSETSLPLHALGKNKHYELMYSLGVSFLYSGQGSKAFECLTEAVQQFHNNPRLWLRLAECCILCHKSSNKIDFDVNGRRKDIIQKVVGESDINSGISRKFVLASSLSKCCKYNAEGLSYAIPQPTLEYAMLCLKNALFLLPTVNCEETNIPVINTPSEEGAKKTIIGQQQSSLLGSLTPTASHKLGNNANSTSHTNATNNSTKTALSQSTIIENLNLKISILTASSYVSLCLGDYIQALHYAKTLLNIKKLPGAQWLVGNLYAAESLIFLDRIYEALEHLKLDNLQDVSTYISIGEVVGDKEKIVEEVIEQKPSKVSWYPASVATAKTILRYNLAVAYAIRGELDKSGEILKQVWNAKSPDCDIPIYVIMLALYIELQLGHIDVARSLIKQHYYPVPQHFNSSPQPQQQQQ